MEKFHHFLYASHFTLETNQKPLETILAKSLTEATPWLQQLLIHTFHYDFTVRYIKGSTNQLADCLSRLGCQKDLIELPKLKIHAITKQLHATSDKLNQFRTETTQDEEMALLKYIVQTGWPHEIHDIPKEIQPYWTFWEQITIEDGFPLKGTHIIVPQTLHKEMIQLLHTGHLGLEKCLNRAKQSMYWPSLYDELKDLITNCTTCLKFSAQKPISNKQHAGHEIPIHPGSKLASDIFHFEGWQLSTHCGLHILFSLCQETEFHDQKSYFPSHAIYIFRIWMAQHTGNRKWTLLHQQGIIPNTNAVNVCPPSYQLSPLSPE